MCVFVNLLVICKIFWNNLCMLKIGVDIEDINRFKDKSKTFLDKVYTKSEQEYCMNCMYPHSRLAARWCAKEAVVKALSGFGIKNVSYIDVEIFHDENKCPCVRILKHIDKNLSFNLSLSHEKDKAIAFVMVEEQ